MTFVINSQQALINFQTYYCTTMPELIDSDPFRQVLIKYFHHLEKMPPLWWVDIKPCIADEESLRIQEVIKVFKLLLVLPFEEIVHPLMNVRKSFYLLVEDLYNFWRKLERYAFLFRDHMNEGIAKVSFIDADSQFNALVLRTYRRISETLRGESYQVYRQLSAGTNVSLILDYFSLKSLEDLEKLSKVPVITSVLMHAPFIIYPKNTKRDGTFQEIHFNPLTEMSLNPDQFIGYALRVGPYLAMVYFHHDFLNLGVSLANLFTPAPIEQISQQKIDLVYVYGATHPQLQQTVFYVDQRQKRYIGFAPYSEDITYFGYMKKMLLTLHNLKQIEAGNWPLHGAMVSLLFRSGRRKNVIMVGDSGAGKSETIEALKAVAGDQITAMDIVFDDMGSAAIEEGELRAYGTETGAFVRLDDLDEGYAYKEIDRAIFMNPDKNNARTIIPVSFYEEIMAGHSVDLLLYANNFDHRQGIRMFSSAEEALHVFRLGQRVAKQTTSEKGLVTSFYANPFGPVQRKEAYETIAQKFMNYCFKEAIPVGEIYTHLALPGEEKSGPRTVALALFAILDKD